MTTRQVGAEPSSPFAQLEHLANLLRNSEQPMESQLIRSLKAKIVEDIEKQMVRRLRWDGKVPGICAGTQATVAPGSALVTRYREESQITNSLRYQSREGSLAPGGTWMLEVAGGNRDEMRDTWRQYTSTRTVEASTREIEVPDDIQRMEELGCVRP